MNKQDFYFDLPKELIALYPLAKRSDSRLLSYNRATTSHGHYQFNDLPKFLNPGDLLVMNNTKVIPARLYGMKATGGKVDLLVERVTGSHEFLAHIRSSKSPKPGSVILLANNKRLIVQGRKDDLFVLESEQDILDLLYEQGHIPLPPYINREDEAVDKARYQTIYAQHAGSVAAPTAGLHFDESVMSALQSKGVNIGYVTLHVGAGTFRPVRTDNIKDHVMHSECFEITDALCAEIEKTKIAGGRVIAVGTTAMRTLESAFENGRLQSGSGETNIFIYPGYQFKICDGLITNFHLPESTLLMLVSAFIGHKQAMDLYQVAIDKKYRFFSYGDCTLLL